MNIDIVSENAYARKVQVTIPADTVRAELDKAFLNVRRTARLPGFRQGRVPRKVLEKRFGGQIRAEVAGNLIQDAYTKALDDHSLEPISRPTVAEQGDIAANVDFTFAIALEVKPEVEAETYTGLSVYWPPSEVTDDEVDQVVEARRQTLRRLTSVEGRAVQAGDTVQVQLVARNGDDTILDEPGTLVRIDDEAWLKGLSPLLEGMEIDEEKTGTVTFADDAQSEAVAGKELEVTAKVLAIQAYEVPELSDDTAKELGHEDGVDAMKSSIRDEIASSREENARNQARANLLEALIEANSFDVPQSMVERNLELLIEELKLQRAYRGEDPRNIRFTEATIADLRQRAAFAAKGGLLLESVSRQEELEVSDDDLEAKYAEMAAERDQTVEAIKGYFEKDGAVDDLRERLLEEKTLDWLLDQAEVTHEAPEPEAAADEEAASDDEAAGASDEDAAEE